jgi:hypothetical protein
MPDESLFQTVTRNIMPQKDTSKTALGPGQMFTSGDSPQSEGEQQYKEKFGSPQEVAYGKIKNWFSEHEQHFSDKVLKPFRDGLDNMADEIDKSPIVKAASPTAQGVAKGTAELLRAVPVGKNVKDTAAMAFVPDFSSLEGHILEEEAPQLAYRARPVGQKGVAAGERPVATSSLDKAKTYKENLESMTGQPHEVVQIPLKKGEHTVHAGPDDDKWFSLKKDVPEESVKIHGKEKPAGPGEEPDNEREIRTRTANVKPIKFGDSDVAKEKPGATEGLKEPKNKSRIVIEGIDEPKPNPEGKYSDKIKIDPFSPSYKPRKQAVKTA